MKISIIGGGTMGMTYARNIAKMNGVVPAGACDIDPQRAEKLAETCGTRAYTDTEVMLREENPDVVCVCLPTYLHKPFVIDLAARGKHIICEKPLTLHLDDAREMIDACSKAGVQFFVGHVLRFFPNYYDAFDKVRSGVIGRPGVAHFKRMGSYPQGADKWYHDRSKSGGVILDLMIHDIDYARMIFGEAESVFARISSERKDMEYAQVTIQFANRGIANLEGYWGYPGSFTTGFEIAGDRGIIRFDSNQTSALDIKRDVILSDEPAVQVPKSPMIHDPYYIELEHFLTCIQKEQPPLVTVMDAYKAMEIALAAEQSAKLGKPVALEGKR